MLSSRAKVMQQLAGRPLISYVISAARALLQSKEGQITVVTGYGHSQVQSIAIDSGCNVVHQEEQLGTGHALEVALRSINPVGTTLVLYGDVPLINKDHLLPLMENSSKGLAVLVAQVDDPSGYGRILRDKDGQLVAIVEHKDASITQRQICEINSGIYSAPTELFKTLLPKLKNTNSQGEYYLTDCVELCVSNGWPVSTVAGPSHVTLGVNDQQQLTLLNSIVQQELRENLLRAGVHMLDPNSVYIAGDVSVGSDVVIEPNVFLKGQVKLGDQVVIGYGCYLKDCRVNNGAVIKPYSVIESAIIGSEAQVGPFSRLRPGTKMADQSCVGNFCEVKNADIGKGSKVNHLSYLGDSSLGESTNLGAGTITCNYDGANKNTTIIGNNVFVGSNTSLVAPITLEDGATVGAGSVVTKDVGTDELVIARAKQEHITGYKRPKKSKG